MNTRICSESCCWNIFLCFEGCMHACSVTSVLFDSVTWTAAHQAPLLWDFLGKDTGVGCHFYLQGIFLTQALNKSLLCITA